MKSVSLAAAGVLAALSVLLTAGPAAAHGAPTDPVSRSAACGPEGRSVSSAACVTAIAASGRNTLDWDNLRVPNVGGRDREVIPDGKLCSAGIPRFAGLDAPRADWPVTALRDGARLTLRYRATIPHEGTFRVYLTRPGYDPAKPLRWSDLDAKPFLTATDPALKGGSYTMSGTLPKGRTGRHMIYTIWQNSGSPDTYYSCSDVTFGGQPAAAQPDAAGQPAAGQPGAARPATGQPDAPPAAAATDATPAQAQSENSDEVTLAATTADRVIPWAGAILALLFATCGVLLLRHRYGRGSAQADHGAHRRE